MQVYSVVSYFNYGSLAGNGTVYTILVIGRVMIILET